MAKSITNKTIIIFLYIFGIIRFFWRILNSIHCFHCFRLQYATVLIRLQYAVYATVITKTLHKIRDQEHGNGICSAVISVGWKAGIDFQGRETLMLHFGNWAGKVTLSKLYSTLPSGTRSLQIRNAYKQTSIDCKQKQCVELFRVTFFRLKMFSDCAMRIAIKNIIFQEITSQPCIYYSQPCICVYWRTSRSLRLYGVLGCLCYV